MDNQFQRLNPDEVVSTSGKIMELSRTFKISELFDELNSMFESHFGSGDMQLLFDEGLDSEVLKLGATNWQTGKIRLSVEFSPVVDKISESSKLEANPQASPLEDIRQMVTEGS